MTELDTGPSPRMLDRPKGYAPRGTSLGLVGSTGLAVGVPFGVLGCAAPLAAGGADRWLASIPYVMAFGMLPCVIFLTFARTRRRWTVAAFFYLGSTLLISYVFGLMFVVSAVTGLFTVRDEDLAVMRVVFLIYFILLALPAWFLLRALRLRYWQPGSTPDQWELGDEGPPAWAMSNARKP